MPLETVAGESVDAGSFVANQWSDVQQDGVQQY